MAYATRGYAGRMIDEDEVTEALSNVIDPELGLDFVELGLIYGVEIDGGAVEVTFTLTTPACPIGPQVSEQIVEFVGEIEGVDSVTPTMVFSPPWTPDKMSEDAKFALGY
jgi:metal-sulfur cluster biosynthetic enzyme